MPELGDKYRQARGRLAGLGRAVVAFSGGVDSTLLAVMACEVLGRANVLAVTADSPSLAREDLAEAVRLARQLELSHEVIATHETADPAYRRNTPARCYICKHELFEELEDLATARGFRAVLYGAIGDDLRAERPGQRAALAFGVLAPLQDAGLTKREVRQLAKTLGLPNWDRPQNACLASRIPHGMDVTEEKLRQIEQAEAMLREAGFRQVRVRHLGRHARIEVEPEELSRFHDVALRARITERFETLGFETVGIDRAGYQTGGADRVLADEVLLSSLCKC